MKRILTAGFSALLFILLLLPAAAAEEASAPTANRYNIMLVLDASGSLNSTDPRGYRFDAVNLFANLLPEEGNVVGGVVFSTDIDREVVPVHIGSQEEKDALVQSLRTVYYPGGWTNIGKGLSAAADLLAEHGDESLPSAVILFSDGNTAMYTEEETRQAVARRDEAVSRLTESEIPVYSICLNAVGTADGAEMQAISDQTGGVYAEVREASDLNGVLQIFYELIYGSSTVTLADDVFPAEGLLETPFTVPGFGVEEVNIVLLGRASDVSLVRPDNSVTVPEVNIYDSFSSVKLTEFDPGEWTLQTRGVSGDRIRIEVIYNTNLSVALSMFNEDSWPNEPEEFAGGDLISFRAKLSAGSREAMSSAEYEGFAAELVVYDGTAEELRRIPMTVGDEGFELDTVLDEGRFFYEASVTGNSLAELSNRLGPIEVTAAEPEPVPEPTPEPTPPPNTAPRASVGSVTETVIVWPVVGGKGAVDLHSLISDREDSSLRFTASSSEFAESEYMMSPAGQLNLRPSLFRLRGGSISVQATDSEGLSCELGVRVRVVNAFLILLALIAAGLIVLLAVLLSRREKKHAFHGTLTVTSEVEGVVKSSAPVTPRGRGKYALSHFTGIDQVGLDYSKCYFQAGSDAFVFLITDRDVLWRGYETRNVRIDSGTETNVLVDGDPNHKLRILYESDELDLNLDSLDLDFGDF